MSGFTVGDETTFDADSLRDPQHKALSLAVLGQPLTDLLARDAEKLFAARYQFDKTLADLQQLLAEIHTHGGKDVIAYREIGDSSEIYRERRD